MFYRHERRENSDGEEVAGFHYLCASVTPTFYASRLYNAGRSYRPPAIEPAIGNLPET
jgi:hypothetical protein